MRTTYLHTQWHWRWCNLSWHLFDCERKEAAKKQQSWPPKCHQMPSIWGKWYWTCSVDVRSFSCVCIPAEHLCLCAGAWMYVKSHEDCFPCVHESWQQKGTTCYQKAKYLVQVSPSWRNLIFIGITLEAFVNNLDNGNDHIYIYIYIHDLLFFFPLGCVNTLWYYYQY